MGKERGKVREGNSTQWRRMRRRKTTLIREMVVVKVGYYILLSSYIK